MSMKSLALGMGALWFAAGAAMADPSASDLFFGTPYLSKLESGARLDYAYVHRTAEPKLGEGFEEQLKLKVDGAPEDRAGRVVKVDIKRGDRETGAGPFPAMNGNPITLILLERDVNEMAQLSKGSPFYIRNRVREHISSGTVEPARFDYGGRAVEGWKLSMTPFAEDPNKDKLQELTGRRYSFLFSEAVPGGLYSVEVVTPAADGSANLIETRVTLSDPLSAEAK